DQALGRYRRKFAWRLGPHHFLIADFSTGRKTTRLERLMFRRGATDPKFATAFGEVFVRERSPFRLLDPRVIARLAVPAKAEQLDQYPE
ncbi:MAG: hypothetical protein ACJ75Z_08575, partial [Solirubrobacterales bacterium]